MQHHQHVQENLSHKDFLILACLVEQALTQREQASPGTGSAATGARLSNESYPDVLSPGPLWLALFRKCFWSLDKVL
jgi:hypothetical protein